MGTKAVIILSLCIIGLVSSATLTWIADSISFVTQGSTTSSSQWNYDVTADSNGPLYPDVGGHFTLSLTMTYSNGLQYIAQTECINLVTDKPSDIQQKITNSAFNVLSAGQSIDIGGKLGNVVIPKSKKFLNNYNSTSRSKTTLHFEFVSKVPSISTISVTADRTKCKSIRTFGKWSDKTRWREGKVPSSIDNVIISAGSGVILFKNDVTVSSLTTEGGELQLLKSGCPQDWSIEDTSDTLA